MITFAASVGWKASQNKYSFLFLHGLCKGKQVICPLFLPTPQHPAFVTLKPETYRQIAPFRHVGIDSVDKLEWQNPNYRMDSRANPKGQVGS